jgi:hypothetical protein
VLKVIFGPKTEEVTEGWRKLHNEEVYNLYFSQNILKVITARMMGGHVACMVETRNSAKLYSENVDEKDHMGDLGMDVRTVVKWVCKEIKYGNMYLV